MNSTARLTTLAGLLTFSFAALVVSHDEPAVLGARTPPRSPSLNAFKERVRKGHAAFMCASFVVLFPTFALLVYLPYTKRIPWLHAPLQLFTLALTIAGLGCGIKLAEILDEVDYYHTVVGYIVVAMLFICQPALGLLQHLHFRRTGKRSYFGFFHRGLGYALMLLGVINGGLGFMLSAPLGHSKSPVWGVVVYSVISILIFLFYIVIVVVNLRRSSRIPAVSSDTEDEGQRWTGNEKDVLDRTHKTSPH